MKKFITVIALSAVLALPASVSASQYGQGAYGQGVVLGEEKGVEIVHEPLETGLAENLGVAGALMIAGSFILRFHFRKSTIEA